MTKTEFNRRVRATGLTSKGIPAALDVLVNGASIYVAAKDHDVSYPVLWRVVDRLNKATFCSQCGQEVKTRDAERRLRRLNA